MALYSLESKKSTIVLQTNENVPDSVKYIEYKGLFFQRSEVKRADGTPDPYLWPEVEGALEEGAMVVNGKDLISTQTMTMTASGVQQAHVSEAAVKAMVEEAVAKAGDSVKQQLDEANARAEAAEAALAEMKRQLDAAGIEITPDAPAEA